MARLLSIFDEPHALSNIKHYQDKVVFEANVAVEGSGGAIYVDSSLTQMSIRNGTFARNKCTGDGGSCRNLKTTLSL